MGETIPDCLLFSSALSAFPLNFQLCFGRIIDCRLVQRRRRPSGLEPLNCPWRREPRSLFISPHHTHFIQLTPTPGTNGEFRQTSSLDAKVEGVGFGSETTNVEGRGEEEGDMEGGRVCIQVYICKLDVG